MKAKTTRRALLMSALSLLLCVSMLIGSTFAWFTDSVTSAGNKIQAGTLDVQLLMKTAEDADYVDISNSTDPIFGEGSIAQDNNAETLWEPGKTQVAYLAIKNNGSLALKYMVGLDVQNVSKDLYKVMRYTITPDAQYGEVTAWDEAKGLAVVEGTQTVTDGYIPMAPGDVHYFALSIHMQEEADNEYQGGIVNFDLTVLAAQLAAEEDSFDNTYDEDATRESNITVDDTQTLQEAFDDAQDGDVITVAEDLKITEPLVYDTDAAVTLDLGGNAIIAEHGNSGMRSVSNLDALIRVSSGELTIQNGTFKNVKENATETIASIHLSGDAVAQITDVSIETSGTGILIDGNAKITELNAEVTSYVNANGNCNASAIYLSEGSNARIDLISGGKYVSTYTDAFIDAYTGSFSGVAIYPISINGADASIGEISGGTFLGRADDGRNGAVIYVNAGKIEKISGGYFGYCEYTLRNYPYFMITVNTANGASIDAITGGTFEYANGFGCDFENIVAQSGSTIVERTEKKTVSVKLSSSVKTKDVAIWDVVSQ